MDLEVVESRWNTLKNNETELEKQLEENRAEQTTFLKMAVKDGFYWQENKWVKGDD